MPLALGITKDSTSGAYQRSILAPISYCLGALEVVPSSAGNRYPSPH